MQEQQNVTARLASARVHLHGAATQRDDHAVGERCGKRGGRITAPAIDHDHLGAGPAQRLQRRERGPDGARLVENGNDDGNHLLSFRDQS